MQEEFVAYSTIIRKEIRRITRIWMQTLIPPVITMTLYFLIFGKLVGRQIGNVGNFTYMDFIVPGLIMMSVITNSYNNVVSSFFMAKFQRNIEELMVSPTSALTIVLGYMSGGVFRGVFVGLLVILVSMFFCNLQVYNIWIILSIIILTSMLFSLAGFSNALFAKKFDDITIIPTFILTPLTYLGGVFYSIKMLPEFWQSVSRFNPILYMVNAFRYGFLGVSDIDIGTSFFIILLMSFVLFIFNVQLITKGFGIRS
ncbi:MAG: ABC transporter permease [Leptospiraceae bacterium]|nr:ABC transporter permease [Leptospiraceae bacterium]MCP5498372.1 ABC transporter permease [Leptospiraceae bacterium]